MPVLLCAHSCEKEDQVPVYREIAIAKTTSDIIKGDNAFGFSMLKHIVSSEDQGKNIFISPTSISLALAMTYNGAEGNTKKEMEETLMKAGLSREDINESYKSLISALLSVDPKVTMQIANSIWYREGFQVENDFIGVYRVYYNAEVAALDFDSPGAVSIINNWVSENTNRKISVIVNQIPAEAVMYLINAIYFKGIWTNEFNPERTAPRIFLKKAGEVSVPFMNMKESVNYMSNDLVSVIELPYGQGNFSMVVILPNVGKTTGDIIPMLTTEIWDDWIASLSKKEVNISLPKFSFRYENQLNDELAAMGMPSAFTDAADFSGINSVYQLYISKVLHKSFVEVNEEGTEAAAVTSVEVSLTSIGNEIYFTADHPFVFGIREKSTGTIMFLGIVEDPSAE